MCSNEKASRCARTLSLPCDAAAKLSLERRAAIWDAISVFFDVSAAIWELISDVCSRSASISDRSTSAFSCSLGRIAPRSSMASEGTGAI